MKNLLVTASLLMFSLVLSGCGTPLEVYPDFAGDERMWNNMLDSEEPFEFDTVPLAMIMPHHLVAGDVVAQMYASYDAIAEPSTVFIIGPNHYENGESDIQTCKSCVFKTTSGDLELNSDLVSSMVKDGVAKYQDDSFVKEHSIHSHVTYIRDYFPDAEVVPVILKWRTSGDSLDDLADWLVENVPEDALVVASVDFSHYAPLEIADFHDEASKATILNFDYNNVYDLEIDSPASIYTALNFLEKRGYMDAERFAKTNIQHYMTTHTEETTSHHFFAFFKGEKTPYKSASILSMGSLPDDNILSFMDSWRWDPSYNETTDYTTTKQLRDLRGMEDRHLQGADFYVFDMDDNVCRTENQNDMKIAFCKFVEGTYDEDELNETLDRIDNESDLVYLLFEWESGSWTSAKERYVKRLTDDIDIFVGRGLDEIVPMHIYRNSLLFYSLGDFIVDNKLVSDLNSTSEGIMLGVTATEETFGVFIYPIDIINGYPVLKDFSERPRVFAEYTDDVNFGYDDEVDAVYSMMLIDR
ncbi:AmmeMemoRadiSam system protein B [Candidatus Peregrinibacteria bacterium]|jgi:MEMO1 family protein|nr:AmmeMemoRadiSam system protein B [Candidatus Peregrinibacteria bacterium]MBT7736753.1 AmmeMemoRadiSam system protein B [Candidatus Peregrinibacteria bacterium]